MSARDLKRVRAHRWHPCKRFYAGTVLPGERCCTLLHTFLTGWDRVDHRNRKHRDNRRRNLRKAGREGNERNKGVGRNSRSGFKGVGFSKGKWRARIFVQGRRLNLGRFNTARDAAKAYDRAARRFYGRFAWLNFENRR